MTEKKYLYYGVDLAMHLLRPGAIWEITDNKITKWDDPRPCPTWEEIEDTLEKIKSCEDSINTIWLPEEPPEARSKNSKKIIVLGGGTAGWLTALYMQRYFPTADIKLIQSPEKGIIGVGEATTPNIISSLHYLDIDVNDLIKYTKGTIKNGIKFEHWNGVGHKYYHAFGDKVADFSIDNIFGYGCEDYHLKNIISNTLSADEYLYVHRLCEEKKVDLQRQAYALHFDANEMASYLQKIAKTRGIDVVEGEYKGVEQDHNGFITKIILKDGRSFDLDIVFDCSGFARLLIGSHFKEEWISYKNHLPMKKGIPFWLDNDGDEIEPYSSAIAMKYGWMWKIPLQHRIGSGYIFDSDYIDENQALVEAEQYFNRKLEVRKIIPFEAGRYKNFWVKNCIAVGLSSSFIEPLEATSIFLSLGELEVLRHFLNEFDGFDQDSINLFNEIVSNNMDDTLNFVYLHYLTKRNDSEFWQNFTRNYPPPKKLEETLRLIKTGNLRYYNATDTKTPSKFSLHSYMQVCYGLNLVESINVKNYQNVSPSLDEYKNLIFSLSKKAQSHIKFLQSL